MRIAYFDCFSGAAGDMVVGALIDAGASFQQLSDAIGRLGLSGYSLASDRIKKQGLAATRFSVSLSPTAQPHRHLRHIVEIINAASISSKSRTSAIDIFTRLGEAEAKVHNTTIQKVHFHEVGAVDAIIDVVGAVLALELLGIEKVFCSAIPVGSGTVGCEHGVMPVPAPATAELLKGVPIAACDEIGELITPTGAAILTSLAAAYGPLPAMTPTAAGYGAGTREGKTRPNVLRVVIGDAQGTASAGLEQIVQLETNLDDVTPQTVAYCLERLFAAGALDAWTQPIHMKKQRSGLLLSVLCQSDRAEAMERILFAETPTLGVRRRPVERRTLARRIETVRTKFGTIRMKVKLLESTPTASPEYDDCRAAAMEHGAPLGEVMAEAIAAWRVQSAG